jgi:hypothetical protein
MSACGVAVRRRGCRPYSSPPLVSRCRHGLRDVSVKLSCGHGGSSADARRRRVRPLVVVEAI